mmetsp:Transcript_53260/g.158829  ORF Transcript_53260/g.158829 Transcript_53260/m.158829 type:complete len:254 (-) Transcript_53260:111-872(-)
MAEPLQLSLVGPKGGAHEVLKLEPSTTGLELKWRVQEKLDIDPSSQLLFFQNGSRNAAKVAVSDDMTLEEQGILDEATITLKVNQSEVKPENSVLRRSIEKNGGSSYYYAHANEKDLPPELRYVYGGAPAKLGEAEPQQQSEPEALPAQAITRYSWADEGEFICVYIAADGEAEAVEAAKDGKGGEVKVVFEPKSVELRISRQDKDFALVLRNLECEIDPDNSKHRVSAGKRVTLKLKKKKQATWTRLIRPQR